MMLLVGAGVFVREVMEGRLGRWQGTMRWERSEGRRMGWLRVLAVIGLVGGG
jgi:hypothetical protein